MNRTQQVGIAPANHKHANNFIHIFAGADWPIVPEDAAEQPMRAQIIRNDFEGPVGNSNLSDMRGNSAGRIGTKWFFNTDFKMAISLFGVICGIII